MVIIPLQMDCDPPQCLCGASNFKRAVYQTLFSGSLKDKKSGKLSRQFLFRIKKSISMKPSFCPRRAAQETGPTALPQLGLGPGPKLAVFQ
jgi:hypothetical protein